MIEHNMKRKFNIRNKCLIGIVSIILLCIFLVISICENRRLANVNYSFKIEIDSLLNEVNSLDIESESLRNEVYFLTEQLESDVAEADTSQEMFSDLEYDIERLKNHLYFLVNTDYAMYITVDEGFAIGDYVSYSGII